MRAAISIGGHIRTVDLYNNIKRNILDVLNVNGIETDIFISTWNTEGHRDYNFEGGLSIDRVIHTFNPVVIEVEKNNRDYFLTKYKSDKVNKKYSCPETSGDSASMWYKIWRTNELISSYSIDKNIKYYLIFRIRSDIEMNTPLDISDVTNCLIEDVVYMPVSHGLYTEVTKGMMDHYFFGPTSIMSSLLNVYLHIPYYLTMDTIPHTAEGFLWKKLEDEGIVLKRFVTSYNVRRSNRTEKVV